MLIEAIAIGFKALFVLPPIFVDLDVDFEIDALLEELFEGFACFGRYLLEGNAFVADDDAFLTVAFYVDNGADVDALFAFLEFFDGYFDGVRSTGLCRNRAESLEAVL